MLVASNCVSVFTNFFMSGLDEVHPFILIFFIIASVVLIIEV